jgi:predicted alpha/beta-fold hydrolase
MGRIYRERFLRSLRRKALAKLRRFSDLPFDVASVRACRSFLAFDDCVTAPLHGFAGAADYYARSSAGPLLGEVRRPLLAIAAEDDPMVPWEALPFATARANPAVHLEVYPAGGHVGFVSGRPWRFEFFAEARAAAFLAEAVRR